MIVLLKQKLIWSPSNVYTPRTFVYIKFLTPSVKILLNKQTIVCRAYKPIEIYLYVIAKFSIKSIKPTLDSFSHQLNN